MISMVSRAATRAGGLASRSLMAMAGLFAAVFVLAGLSLPGTAAAQGVYGSQVQLSYIFPNPTTAFCTVGPVTAGAGEEYSVDCGASVVSVDVTPDTVVLTFIRNFSFNGPVFSGGVVTHNGVRLTFTGAPDLSGATVVSGSAGIAGFVATSDSVMVDFSDQVRTNGDVITINLNLDTTPPAAPVITSPMSGTITQAVTEVSGTSEPNADITVYITGGTAPTAPSGAQAVPVGFFGATRADSSGNWSVRRRSLDVGLAMGGRQSVGETPTTLTAEATDAAGNTSPLSAPVTLTTDSVPPVTPTVTTPASGATVNSATPTFTGTGEPGSLITVYVDGNEWGQAIVDMSGNWSDGGAQGAPKGAASGPRAPLSAGPHTWYVTSEDAAGNVSAPSASIPFNIVLLSINETSLSNGAVASAFSRTLTTTGCTGPCTFAVTSGALPAGVTLSSAGVFSGTPTAGGVFNFTVTVTDAGAGGITAEQAYTLTINAPTVSSASTLVAGQRGFAYSQTLVGSGGTGPYTFA
ncbi:MAG: Ig-like domain-containing protein, partial [Brevundimonas sp.]